ncbi:hypothetical protein MKX08_005764 [Trichoderma sp. CBMAI-0020]|nr:hypothetical protein MKX08_005764 [Trichoderma sp. CBMAI-0020]
MAARELRGAVGVFPGPGSSGASALQPLIRQVYSKEIARKVEGNLTSLAHRRFSHVLVPSRAVNHLLDLPMP